MNCAFKDPEYSRVNSNPSLITGIPGTPNPRTPQIGYLDTPRTSTLHTCISTIEPRQGARHQQPRQSPHPIPKDPGRGLAFTPPSRASRRTIIALLFEHLYSVTDTLIPIITTQTNTKHHPKNKDRTGYVRPRPRKLHAQGARPAQPA